MLKEIKDRRSIRKYQDVAYDEQQIIEILKAAMQAPTARNRQTWKFIVVTNKKALQDMPELSPSTSMMKTANFAIIVVGDRKLDDNDAYLYVNGAAAIENMLLEAEHLGLGSCWCAIGPNEDRIKAFKEYYQIADDLLPIAVVAFGVSDETKEFIDRYDESKITWVK